MKEIDRNYKIKYGDFNVGVTNSGGWIVYVLTKHEGYIFNDKKQIEEALRQLELTFEDLKIETHITFFDKLEGYYEK